MDDEEEMLYGDCNPAGITPTKDESHPGYRLSSGALGGGSEGRLGRAEPTHWCMMVRENGVMEVRINVYFISIILTIAVLYCTLYCNHLVYIITHNLHIC